MKENIENIQLLQKKKTNYLFIIKVSPNIQCHDVFEIRRIKNIYSIKNLFIFTNYCNFINHLMSPYPKQNKKLCRNILSIEQKRYYRPITIYK